MLASSKVYRSAQVIAYRPSTMASSVLSSYLLSDHMVQVPSAAMSSCQRHRTLSEHFACSLMTSQAQEVLDWDLGLSLRTSSGPWHLSIYLSSMFLYCEG